MPQILSTWFVHSPYIHLGNPLPCPHSLWMTPRVSFKSIGCREAKRSTMNTNNKMSATSNSRSIYSVFLSNTVLECSILKSNNKLAAAT